MSHKKKANLFCQKLLSKINVHINAIYKQSDLKISVNIKV